MKRLKRLWGRVRRVGAACASRSEQLRRLLDALARAESAEYRLHRLEERHERLAAALQQHKDKIAELYARNVEYAERLRRTSAAS